MLVREVMTEAVVTVRSTDPVRRAVRVLHAADITAAPVLGEDGGLIGIVSEMDLLRGEFERDPRASARTVLGHGARLPLLVEEVMTPEVVSVTPTTDVVELVDLMVGKRIKSLPVVADGRLAGIVSRRDLLAVLARTDEDLRADVRAALREQYPAGPHWEVSVRDGVAELRGHAGDPADRIADLLARTVPGIVRVTHSGP
ncbi:CBS domain-containing protein [Planomonospora sp. ID82291]|uniref:CBS domain-containing protein n=1 Tax=Planomonospora sp. ID82291 TaxID=2738136 RepID=UPI0018C426CE|nr:CBS domain-containing protein [Planomonospora sp. ID82291]MBG0815509.1 CBS domain-containing protein [Planomonospora sp. ID82291]